ncbi:hypothetical protein EAF04_004939 [Stromatinia cepivora]|nr:hypothetical protein EAF04_004939 [Stromatinia cepivora]
MPNQTGALRVEALALEGLGKVWNYTVPHDNIPGLTSRSIADRMSVDAEMYNHVTIDRFQWIEGRDSHRQAPSDLTANRQDPDWASLDSFPWIESRETSATNHRTLDSSEVDHFSTNALDSFPWITRCDEGNGISDEDSVHPVLSGNIPCSTLSCQRLLPVD